VLSDSEAHHTTVVISAKAEIQALNEQKPPSRRLLTLKIYLWVADPRQVTFLCLSKEKSPKEMTPRSARLLLPFLAPPGARQLAGRTLRASGSNTVSLNYSRWGCGTRRALRGELAKYSQGLTQGTGSTTMPWLDISTWSHACLISFTRIGRRGHIRLFYIPAPVAFATMVAA